MGAELTATLPSNILTTKQYEDQQAKLRVQEEDLDRTAFLTLFTTQLKNQNPLDPMDNEAFVSQLAQFSSLEAVLHCCRASLWSLYPALSGSYSPVLEKFHQGCGFVTTAVIPSFP